LGLTMLAIYQNYYFIMSAVIAMVEILISSITAGLGNSFVTETKEKNYNDLLKFSFLFLWLIGICICCFLSLYQPFMEIWVGSELMLGFGVVVCLSAYFFVLSMSRFLSVFKDAAGLWHQDRFRPLASALVNLTLNLLTVRKLGIYGIVLSTVLAKVLVGLPWLIYNLFTYMFDRTQLKGFLKQLLGFVAVMALAGAAVCGICLPISLNPWAKMAVCVAVCAVVPNGLFYLLMHRSPQFAPSVQFADRITKGKLKLEKRLLRG